MSASYDFSRRRFLRDAGLAGALLPWLPGLDGKPARAAEAPPRRFVVLCYTNGIIQQDFWPAGDGEEFKLGQTLAPLEPWKTKMNVLAGIDLRSMVESKCQDGKTECNQSAGGGHHDYPCVLTGARLSAYGDGFARSGGDSIDRYVGRKLAEKHGLAIPSLVVGAWTGSGFMNTISYDGASNGVTPENDPSRLWKTLFESRALPSAAIDKARLERRSILDFLGRDLERFSRRLGVDERAAIELHLAQVRDVEKRLAGELRVPECSVPQAPPKFRLDQRATFDNQQYEIIREYPAVVDAHLRLIVAALRCDLTRVATFTMSDNGGDNIAFPWLGSDFLGAGDEYEIRVHHDIAHLAGNTPHPKNALNIARKIKVDNWYFQQVANLVKLLNETPEGDGTMLDNTVVVATNSMGQNHHTVGVPWVLIGNCARYFKTGRLLRFAKWREKPVDYWNLGYTPTGHGIPHNGVLVALANAVGVPVETFGDPRYGGELTALRSGTV